MGVKLRILCILCIILIFLVLISSLIRFLLKEGLTNFNEEITNIFYINRDKFTFYKEECYNVSETTEWYLLQDYDRVKLYDFNLQIDMIKELEVKPHKFLGGKKFEFLCYDLLEEYGVKYPFEVLQVSTCDNFIYKNKYYYEVYETDFVGCLRCQYSKISEINEDGRIRYSTDSSIDKIFYNVGFAVPSFNSSKVYIDNHHSEFPEMRNDNPYWSVKFRFKLKERNVCKKVEVEEIEWFFDNACSGICDCTRRMSCKLTERFISIFKNETAKKEIINWINNYINQEVKIEDNTMYLKEVSMEDAIKLSIFNDICKKETISFTEYKCFREISKKDLTKEFLDEKCINNGCNCYEQNHFFSSEWNKCCGNEYICKFENKEYLVEIYM